MKRFIAVLTFCLLFFVGKADTLTYYSVNLKGKPIASTPAFGPYSFHLKSEQLTRNDTITISMVGCFGDFEKGKYHISFVDTSVNSELYREYFDGQPILVPVAPLLEQKSRNGSTFFFLYYYPEGESMRRTTFYIYLD